MPLVITRRPGEAVIIEGPTVLRLGWLYVVSIEGNVVRLAFDAPPEVKVTREELLPEEARRRWTEDRAEPVTPPRFERDRQQGRR